MTASLETLTPDEVKAQANKRATCVSEIMGGSFEIKQLLVFPPEEARAIRNKAVELLRNQIASAQEGPEFDSIFGRFQTLQELEIQKG